MKNVIKVLLQAIRGQIVDLPQVSQRSKKSYMRRARRVLEQFNEGRWEFQVWEIVDYDECDNEIVECYWHPLEDSAEDADVASRHGFHPREWANALWDWENLGKHDGEPFPVIPPPSKWCPEHLRRAPE